MASSSAAGRSRQLGNHSSWSPCNSGRPVRAASARPNVLLPAARMPTIAIRSATRKEAQRLLRLLREARRHDRMRAREIGLELRVGLLVVFVFVVFFGVCLVFRW